MAARGPELTEKVKKAIDDAIAAEKVIRIKAYAVIPATEVGLSYIAESILKKYNREDLLGPVYTAVKELAMNGAKANIKRLLFEDHKIDPENDKEYERGMAMFKKNLSEDWVYDYAVKSKKQNLYVDIQFDFNKDRMIMQVINNKAITEREDGRIRDKFREAMRYDDIAQFYMEGGDSSEGAGMGIVLVTMMLKAQGMDPHLFTIRSNYIDATTAKVEFPLSQAYIHSREAYLASTET